MPRYFFHFHDGNLLEPDEDGLEMPDLDAAYLEAFEAAKEIWIDAIRTMHNPSRERFEVADDSGNTLLIVPLNEVMESLKGVSKPPPPLQNAERAAKLSAEVKDAVAAARDALRQSQDLLARFSV
jgi:hypothetical protein